MDLKQANKCFRIFVVILLLLLASLSMYFKFGDCEKCDYYYEEEHLSAREFLEIYGEQCLKSVKKGDAESFKNFSFLNMSEELA